MLLHVALHDGFNDDTVVVKVEGKDVFHKPDVRTKTQISYADSFELDVPGGIARIEVDIPSKGLSGQTQVQVSAPVYLGVSVNEDGSISFRISQEPFGYM